MPFYPFKATGGGGGAPSGPAGGVLSGTYPNPGLAATIGSQVVFNVTGSGTTAAVTTDDITVQPNSGISSSASMFLDNTGGQIWEFFCNSAGVFGVYDKTNGFQALAIKSGTGVVTFAANIATPVKTVTGTYNIAATDSTILGNSGSGFTITLPTPVGITGTIYTVKNINTGTVTLATAAGNIDGSATQSLATNAAFTVQSDGTNWWITGKV